MSGFSTIPSTSYVDCQTARCYKRARAHVEPSFLTHELEYLLDSEKTVTVRVLLFEQLTDRFYCLIV
jgi:hypothetical protein